VACTTTLSGHPASSSGPASPPGHVASSSPPVALLRLPASMDGKGLVKLSEQLLTKYCGGDRLLAKQVWWLWNRSSTNFVCKSTI
jgi:hypothetical protein